LWPLIWLEIVLGSETEKSRMSGISRSSGPIQVILNGSFVRRADIPTPKMLRFTPMSALRKLRRTLLQLTKVGFGPYAALVTKGGMLSFAVGANV
jgi:hypothetical protein